MLRRSILQISSRRGLTRIPKVITSQHASRFLRREFSAAGPKTGPAQPGIAGKPPPADNGGGSTVKVFLGSAALGAGLVAAYKTGLLDPIFGGQDKSALVKEGEVVEEKPSVEEEKPSGEEVGKSEEKIEMHSDAPHAEGLSGNEGADQPQVVDNKSESETTREKSLPQYSQNANLGLSSEGNADVKSTEEKTSMGLNEEVQITPIVSQASTDQKQENEVKPSPPQQDITEDKIEKVLCNDEEPSTSLLKTYHLSDEADENIEIDSTRQGGKEYKDFPNEKEALVDAIEGLGDAYISKDGKLVLDFLQAIHTAEKRQAELDARILAEEKRTLKERYEKKLKDAGARELMLAEEAAMLDKELKRERAKAAAALKSLQEKLEEKFKTELEQKENEAETKLKKVEELARAERAAAIASEKTSQIEKIAEANLHINALCAAFYARSKEARQTHSAHKLALGALALEDALSKGLPIQTEIEALHTYLEGIDKDSILDLVLSSLPEETRKNGTDTLLQLNQKFDALKGTVRHLSLIPPGGGGILAHTLAFIASSLKVKEVDQSGDGIESIINKVEYYLAEGKIAEAAEALEEGVKGTQATEVVGDWVKRARNRAITDQALTLLQSYATSISVT